MDLNNPNSPNNSNPEDHPNSQNLVNFSSYFSPDQLLPNSEDYQNAHFSPNLNQSRVSEEIPTSQNVSRNLFEQPNTTQKVAKNIWGVREDVALMSSWCYASENKMRGKNQKGASLWTRVHKLYEEARAEKPQEISERNVNSMKSRWKRLSEAGSRWVASFKEAEGRKMSGMSYKDVEKEAHTIYEACGSKFQDIVVFNEVMCKHPKWDLTLLHDTTPFRSENEESNGHETGGSSKRSRTTEDGEYSVPSNPETPSTGCSTIPRPTGRDKAKKKGKGKASQSESTNNEIAAEIRALRLTRDTEVELMSKMTSAKMELEHKKEQRKALKMEKMMLNTLLAKDNCSPQEEEMKHHLMAMLFNK